MTEQQQEHIHHKQGQLAVPVEDLKPVRTASSKKENKGILFISDAENGVEEKPKKATKQLSAQLLPLNTEEESFNGRKASPLTRSKTYDSSFSPADVDYEGKLERKKSSTNQFSKANAHFHKLFQEVAVEEPLKQSFACALQKDILYQGKLFVSENWIGFHSKVFGKDTKILIPVASVILIKKTKTALLVPNAVIIATQTERYLFVSLLSRDGTYKLLKSVCVHIDNKSLGTSPNPSSLESSFRAERPTSLPLDTIDFSSLDGVVRHRRQEMEQTSSSGSQTPESENYQDLVPRTTTKLHHLLPPSHPDGAIPSTSGLLDSESLGETKDFLKVPTNEQGPAHADILIKPSPERKSHLGNAGNFRSSSGLLHKAKSAQLLSVNHLLLFYAVLVCALIFSTFYMGFKILALEQRLSSMGSLPDFQDNDEQIRSRGLASHLNMNADTVYNELTANLAKLEKVQKNLQRLLKETK